MKTILDDLLFSIRLGENMSRPPLGVSGDIETCCPISYWHFRQSVASTISSTLYCRWKQRMKIMTISFVQTQLPCFDSYQFPLAVGFTEKMRSFKSISTNNQKRVYFFCERTISDQGVANRDKDQSTWENMRKTENIWGCLGLAILLWWQKKINVLNQKK